MESTESRFAHLLQPIRDLTKNWDIDVASELNDYLEEVNVSKAAPNLFLRADGPAECLHVLSVCLCLQLDEMCITFDGGNIKLNFAEAALLIQGSACIYSKKVMECSLSSAV